MVDGLARTAFGRTHANPHKSRKYKAANRSSSGYQPTRAGGSASSVGELRLVLSAMFGLTKHIAPWPMAFWQRSGLE